VLASPASTYLNPSVHSSHHSFAFWSAFQTTIRKFVL
jgi:hypothetical protein